MSTRFSDTFRERMPEWIMSGGLLAWGIMILNISEKIFSTNPFLQAMTVTYTQESWGFAAIGIGIARLIFLIINGAWRPSAHFRAIGCAFGAVMWASLTMAAAALDWNPPIMALFMTCMFSDIISLWFSAGDAKLADLSAKS